MLISCLSLLSAVYQTDSTFFSCLLVWYFWDFYGTTCGISLGLPCWVPYSRICNSVEVFCENISSYWHSITFQIYIIESFKYVINFRWFEMTNVWFWFCCYLECNYRNCFCYLIVILILLELWTSYWRFSIRLFWYPNLWKHFVKLSF